MIDLFELLRAWLVAGLLLTPILGGFCALSRIDEEDLPCP